MEFSSVVASPLGKLGIVMRDATVTSIQFLSADAATFTNTAAQAAVTQLEKYFADPEYQFSLPYSASGTEFQQRVWRALCEIPAGTTLTYGQLAQKLNSSPRAVGQACRRNPIPVIVPCHRVVGANSFGGYAGDTTGDLLQVKKWLLGFEKQKL